MDLDLTGLNELVQFINSAFQAFLPIILIVAFVGFIVLIFGGAKLLGKLTGMGAYPHAIKKASRSKTRILKLSIAFMFGILAFSAMTPAAAIDGTLTLGTTQVMRNTPITVTASDLTASTAYAIYWGDTAIINWTSAATPDDMTVTFEATPPSSGNTVDLYLYSAATAVVTQTVYVTSASTFLPTGFIISGGVAVMMIGLVALVIVAIVKKRG
jgi:hypothetical protein